MITRFVRTLVGRDVWALELDGASEELELRVCAWVAAFGHGVREEHHAAAIVQSSLVVVGATVGVVVVVTRGYCVQAVQCERAALMVVAVGGSVVGDVPTTLMVLDRAPLFTLEPEMAATFCCPWSVSHCATALAWSVGGHKQAISRGVGESFQTYTREGVRCEG